MARRWNMINQTWEDEASEGAFRTWYAGVAKGLGIDPNPDARDHFYDYRRFYADVASGKAVSPDKPGGHFPSTYKLPGHPREFLADSQGRIFDTKTGLYVHAGGKVPPEELNKAETAPDLPPEKIRRPPPREAR